MVPFVTVGEGMFSDLDVYSLKEGDTVTLDHEVRIRMDTVAAGDGEEWFYIYKVLFVQLCSEYLY